MVIVFLQKGKSKGPTGTLKLLLSNSIKFQCLSQNPFSNALVIHTLHKCPQLWVPLSHISSEPPKVLRNYFQTS